MYPSFKNSTTRITIPVNNSTNDVITPKTKFKAPIDKDMVSLACLDEATDQFNKFKQ